MAESLLQLTVNGQPQAMWIRDEATLLEVLRDELALTGTKNGCAVGHCGACTVWIDGAPRLACVTLARTVAGRAVTTVEGLAGWWRDSHPEEAEHLAGHPLQAAFVAHGAVQCGFCTPGMLMAGAALLRENPHPDRHDIREALAGHLCRCTGYEQIVRAVAAVGAAEKEGSA